MVTVTFTREGKKLSLHTKGHAGYEERGKDIVCASCSILAYTLSYVVGRLDGVELIEDIRSGNTTIECECKDPNTFKSLRDAFHFTEVGYALLQRNYPQYVELIHNV